MLILHAGLAAARLSVPQNAPEQGDGGPYPTASPALPARVWADSRGCVAPERAPPQRQPHMCVYVPLLPSCRARCGGRHDAHTAVYAQVLKAPKKRARRIRRALLARDDLVGAIAEERSLLAAPPQLALLRRRRARDRGRESANGSHLKPKLPALRHQCTERAPRGRGLGTRAPASRQSARVLLHAHLLLESQAPSESTTARCRIFKSFAASLCVPNSRTHQTRADRSLAPAYRSSLSSTEARDRRFVARCGHFLITSLIKGISNQGPIISYPALIL